MAYYSFNKLSTNPIYVGFSGSKFYNSRYKLDAVFSQNVGRTAIVIMLNPSSTGKANIFFNVNFSNLTDVDETTFKVLETLTTNNSISNSVGGSFDRIIILNLYPYFSSNPRDIKKVFRNGINNQCYELNMKEISRVINNNQNATIVCAWGKSFARKKETNRIVKILQKNKIQSAYAITSKNAQVFTSLTLKQIDNKCAFHGSQW